MTRFTALNPSDYALPEDFAARTLSPALVVRLDVVRANVARVLGYVGGPERWRPHVKTTKIPGVWAELTAAGVRQFKCATTREAALLTALLAERGVQDADVLVAYPLRGPALERLAEIARGAPQVRLSVLCEDADLVAAIPDTVSIFVDVNPGMHRTGVPLEDTDTIFAVARAAGARFRGIHYYDGHLHQDDLDARRRSIFDCYARLIELLGALRAQGIAVGEVVTSGTPSFLHAVGYAPFTELDDTLHRVSPGTVLFHDLRSERENPDLELVPAATVFTRVISHPAADLATCDAGSKSVAAEAGDPCAFVVGHPELVAQTPNEEHLPLRVSSGTRPERGTSLHLVPLHVCPTVNLAEEAVLMEGERVLDVVPVSARAHELRL